MQETQELRIPCLVGNRPWRRKWQSIPVSLPGKIPWTEEPGGLLSMGLINNLMYSQSTKQVQKQTECLLLHPDSSLLSWSQGSGTPLSHIFTKVKLWAVPWHLGLPIILFLLFCLLYYHSAFLSPWEAGFQIILVMTPNWWDLSIWGLFSLLFVKFPKVLSHRPGVIFPLSFIPSEHLWYLVLYKK